MVVVIDQKFEMKKVQMTNLFTKTLSICCANFDKNLLTYSPLVKL